MTQRKFWLSNFILALLAFAVLTQSYAIGLKNPIVGSVFAVVAIYVASPIAMLCRAVFHERRSFREVFDLKIGSWAFLIGDTTVLPLASVFIVFGWYEVASVESAQSMSVFLGCFGVGVLVGGLFHAIDGIGYRSAGAQEALSSPTKITHDFCAYPVLLGGLLYGAIPIVQDWGWYSWAALGCVAVWLLLCVRDLYVGLDPKKLHPRWNKRLFKPLRWLSS